MVIMFCAFEGPPKILRLYGEGEVILPTDNRFIEMGKLFPKRIGTRTYIINHITAFRIPVVIYEFVKERDVLIKWSENKGTAGVMEYHKLKNASSIDGLTGLNF